MRLYHFGVVYVMSMVICNASALGLNRLCISLNNRPVTLMGLIEIKLPYLVWLWVLIKTKNRNLGQKRSLQESQEEDTFSRFEALDDLSQQEVNPGMIPLDHSAVGLVPDSVNLDPTQGLQEVGSQQMEMDQKVLAQMGPISSSEMKIAGEEVSPATQNLDYVGIKSNKISLHLGLLQKDIKKGATEKNSKVGRKEDLEKIKLMGENLVESRSVKTLDSHFSNPSK